jgi:hypothetical protein
MNYLIGSPGNNHVKTFKINWITGFVKLNLSKILIVILLNILFSIIFGINSSNRIFYGAFLIDRPDKELYINGFGLWAVVILQPIAMVLTVGLMVRLIRFNFNYKAVAQQVDAPEPASPAR